MDGSVWGFLMMALMLVLSIVKANESRKKREAERRKKAEIKTLTNAGAGQKSVPAQTRQVGRSFVQVLEELARETSGSGSGSGSIEWFPSDAEFAGVEDRETADYLGTETASDWYDDIYSVEDADAEARYVGGEMGSAAQYVGGEMKPAVRYVGGEMGSAAKRPGEEVAPAAKYIGGEVRPGRAASNNAADRATSEDGSSGGDQAQNDTARWCLHELFEGGFDLRRAVVEAEILTPKYISKY